MWDGPCLIRWGSSEKGLKSLEVEGILPPGCLQTLSWVSSLLAFPADFRLFSLKISLSQSLSLSLCLCLCLCLSLSLSLSLSLCVFKVDPCTIQVWTVQVHLHADRGVLFFFTTFYCTWPTVDWIQESRIIDVEKLCIWGTSYRLYVDFLLYGGLVPLIPMLFKVQLYINTHEHLHTQTHTHTHSIGSISLENTD